MKRRFIPIRRLHLRPPLVGAIPGHVVIGSRGTVWKISPDAAEKLADDLVDMAELARTMDGRPRIGHRNNL
jgi:hypothetical protein